MTDVTTRSLSAAISEMRALWTILAVPSILAASGCGAGEPISAERYAATDSLLEIVKSNVETAESLSVVVEIDHSRLGAEAGSHMPPAKVLIFSAPAVEAAILSRSPLAGVDLPLRVLAYEPTPDGSGLLLYNDWDYLAARHGLPSSGPERALFEEVMRVVLDGIDAGSIGAFERNEPPSEGIVTLDSPFDFDETRERVLAAIRSQDDTVLFDVVPLSAGSTAESLRRRTMILFGGPAPGAKAMRKAPTLGLDAFCQKFLVWESDDGVAHLSYNDLAVLADRHVGGSSLPLEVIRFRLNRTFSKALSD